MNKPFFYAGSSTNNWVKLYLSPFAHVTIFNDSVANPLAISFDGQNIDGFFLNEGVEFRDLNAEFVYIKSYNAGAPANFRLWAYGDTSVIYTVQNRGNISDNPNIPKNYNPYAFPKKLF